MKPMPVAQVQPYMALVVFRCAGNRVADDCGAGQQQLCLAHACVLLQLQMMLALDHCQNTCEKQNT
jgi:hypothetical protein